MEQVRKPFQGILNIIRFNWHFYLISFSLVLLLFLLGNSQPDFSLVLCVIGILVLMISVISLSVSWYVYDLSELYTFKWIAPSSKKEQIINVNAGFDETSGLLRHRFPNSELVVLDFYDPLKHTEISIKRARKAYPAYPGTQEVTTRKLGMKGARADKIFLILSAHEIRNEEERIGFFKELNRVLSPDGQIFVVEHLRDLSNFSAYNIGFFRLQMNWSRVALVRR